MNSRKAPFVLESCKHLQQTWIIIMNLCTLGSSVTFVEICIHFLDGISVYTCESSGISNTCRRTWQRWYVATSPAVQGLSEAFGMPLCLLIEVYSTFLRNCDGHHARSYPFVEVTADLHKASTEQVKFSVNLSNDISSGTPSSTYARRGCIGSPVADTISSLNVALAVSTEMKLDILISMLLGGISSASSITTLRIAAS